MEFKILLKVNPTDFKETTSSTALVQVDSSKNIAPEQFPKAAPDR